MAILQSTTIANTGTLTLPKGTTAQRPGSPTAGMVRFNTTLNYTETYTGTSWVPFCKGTGSTHNSASVVTSSGIHQTTLSNGYRIHNFLSGSHTFTPGKNGRIEVLVVAGGGAGGWDVGGGGGGGGVVFRNDFEVVAGTAYTVTVGAGGVATSNGTMGSGMDGSNSVFGSLTALGGGGGGNWSGNVGRPGGSGGGSTSNVASAGAATQPTSASGGYGNPGGIPTNNTDNSNEYSGGSGGGGAGGWGGNGLDGGWTPGSSLYGFGGPGIACDITGVVRFYGGGGGSSSDGTSFWAHGGIGGGGRGGGWNGEINTGGGGGGCGVNGPNWDRAGNTGGDGGSGIVIVRYADDTPSVCIVWDQIYNTTQVGWTCPAGVTSVELLVVAGGGGGGMDMGGGGGAGGVVYNPAYPVNPTSFYTVQVGQGGTGAPRGTDEDGLGTAPVTGNITDNPNIGSSWGVASQGTNRHQYSINATNGTNSTFGSVTAIGGGYGGSSVRTYTQGGTPTGGGSGGGSSGYNNDGGTRPGGSGVAAQGTSGGAMGTSYYSGGGGGAGGAGGGTSLGSSRSNGGPGLPFSILGPHYYWGGGGGGSGYSNGGGNGGIGGGGAGSVYSTQGGGGGINSGQDGGGGGINTWANTPGGNGGRNTGGGGGGGAHYSGRNQGGNGGSGFVAIRYTPQT